MRAHKPSSLKRPYLFFPTAFRPYKNHRGLVKVLRRPRDHYGVNEFDLVFTGALYGVMPEDVQRLVDAYGFRSRVHVLGGVDRKTLAVLYRGAYAVLVPSLYEQASYQIAEVLYCNVPVACSASRRSSNSARCWATPSSTSIPRTPTPSPRPSCASASSARPSARNSRWPARFSGSGRGSRPPPSGWRCSAKRARWRGKIRAEADADAARPAPVEVFPADPQRLEVFLFLHTAYLGGVWEGTKNLVKALVDINRQRRQLGLVLGVNENQADTAGLRRLAPDLRLEKLKVEQFSLFEARDLLGASYVYPDERKREAFCGYSGQNYPALRADAWFALLDRFPLPLLPARPYGVWVYDMIQRYVPEFFGEAFFNNLVRTGMSPTLRNADVVVTTSAATQQDVIDEYGIRRDRLRLIPLACEPHHRFGTLVGDPVPLPREPFLLYPSNAGGHKGAGVVLRAYARLKERLGDQAPLLVQCGTNSEVFSSQYQPQPTDPPHWAVTRSLVKDLELEEGRDVMFLGFVNDCQLLTLLERCLVVVNAAKFDNGSYSLIEGRYFGRPLTRQRTRRPSTCASASVCRRSSSRWTTTPLSPG